MLHAAYMFAKAISNQHIVCWGIIVVARSMQHTVVTADHDSELFSANPVFQPSQSGTTPYSQARKSAQLCSMSGRAGPPSRQMPTLVFVGLTPMSGAMRPPFSTSPLRSCPMQTFHRCRCCQQCTRGARLMCRPACLPGCKRCCGNASALTLLRGPLLQTCTRLTPALLTPSLARSSVSLLHADILYCACIPWHTTMGTYSTLPTMRCLLLMNQLLTLSCQSKHTCYAAKCSILRLSSGIFFTDASRTAEPSECAGSCYQGSAGSSGSHSAASVCSQSRQLAHPGCCRHCSLGTTFLSRLHC